MQADQRIRTVIKLPFTWGELEQAWDEATRIVGRSDGIRVPRQGNTEREIPKSGRVRSGEAGCGTVRSGVVGSGILEKNVEREIPKSYGNQGGLK